ncbi:MAG: transglycosylase SLT domain-containing protein [Methylobacter sp.]
MFKLRITPASLILLFLCLLAACTVAPPKNGDNICATFREKEDWYDDAKNSYQKWGVPIHVQMAIMHQESHFVADAEPPRPWLLGFIPLPRESSAYGYAQAKDETWDHYLDKAGSWSADRDDFADAMDFIGWYCHVSHIKLGISKLDAKNLYLAYHEGHGGYQRKTYLKKAGLVQIANKVANRAKLFQSQLGECEKDLGNKGWFF